MPFVHHLENADSPPRFKSVGSLFLWKHEVMCGFSFNSDTCLHPPPPADRQKGSHIHHANQIPLIRSALTPTSLLHTVILQAYLLLTHSHQPLWDKLPNGNSVSVGGEVWCEMVWWDSSTTICQMTWVFTPQCFLSFYFPDSGGHSAALNRSQLSELSAALHKWQLQWRKACISNELSGKHKEGRADVTVYSRNV